MQYSLSSKIAPIKEQVNEYINGFKNYFHTHNLYNIIGHRIGDYKHYPKNLNDAKDIHKYKDIVAMIDHAFLNQGLTGIELDLRQWNNNHICVVHDTIRKNVSSQGEEYIVKNSLENVLTHFIEKGYYKHKKLFIEIKVSGKFFRFKDKTFFPDYVSKEERHFIGSVFSSTEEIILKYPDKQQIRNSINFISFSLAALHYAYRSGDENYALYLILSTNQFMKKFLSRFFSYIPLTEAEKLRIQYSEWLKGLWFDPYYLQNPVETLQEINSQRKNKLELFISTYGMDPQKLLEKFKGKDKLEIHGVIFECE
ncbi:MAG: hypothetical protein H7A23_19365 [Leptospiraceae bacterium]|nr:hypothetical protein [Leptospiraceae bacterium]MCP5496715.1 hypothetical protein [Leptospiraceae bacterium]